MSKKCEKLITMVNFDGGNLIVLNDKRKFDRIFRKDVAYKKSQRVDTSPSFQEVRLWKNNRAWEGGGVKLTLSIFMVNKL